MNIGILSRREEEEAGAGSESEGRKRRGDNVL
jgi:hypothetical protein